MAARPDDTADALRLVIGNLARRVRAETTVPLGQLAVLGLLDREGPSTTTALAERQAVRHQSMGRTVAQLVAAGYVEQRPDPADGRRVRLVITADGMAALASERERRVDWLANAIRTKLTTAQQETLAEATTLLEQLMEP